jgi:multiple sugar transport system substrate-binding protein
MLKGDITPAECAVYLDLDCNAALEEGWKNSKLHE